MPNPLTPIKSRKALTRTSARAARPIERSRSRPCTARSARRHAARRARETARLQRRVLADHRVHLTKAGRGDIRHGRVDPRVLVTLEYLANSFHKVGVSDLVSGGQMFSRSGKVSAHIYGRAADVSSLHGKPVRGHQGPDTVTEQAIRKLLLLPSLAATAPDDLADGCRRTDRQPGSFALPDHYNRIHDRLLAPAHRRGDSRAPVVAGALRHARCR